MLAFNRWLGGAHSEELIQKVIFFSLTDHGSLHSSPGRLSNVARNIRNCNIIGKVATLKFTHVPRHGYAFIISNPQSHLRGRKVFRGLHIMEGRSCLLDHVNPLVIYRSAFLTKVNAKLRLTAYKAGFEHEVCLSREPPRISPPLIKMPEMHFVPLTFKIGSDFPVWLAPGPQRSEQ
jgi:hypothetical protein